MSDSNRNPLTSGCNSTCLTRSTLRLSSGYHPYFQSPLRTLEYRGEDSVKECKVPWIRWQMFPFSFECLLEHREFL